MSFTRCVLLFIAISLVAVTAMAEDCARGCSGCKSGRCDVFGCSKGAYCCVDILGSYGACCDSCGPQCPPHCAECDASGCTSCKKGWYGPKCEVAATCARPTGGDCSFYSTCLRHDCPFVTNVELQKCREYHKLEGSLAPIGQKWSQYVRGCLQTAMGSKLLQKHGSSYDCSDAKSVFLDAHIPCYLDGPISFCDLSLRDKVKIFYHAVGVVFKAFWASIRSAGRLKYECDAYYVEGGLRAILGVPPLPSKSTTTAIIAEDRFHALQTALYNVSSTYGWNSTFIHGARPSMSSFVNSTDSIVLGFQVYESTQRRNLTTAIMAEWIVEAAAPLKTWSELIIDNVTYPIPS